VRPIKYGEVGDAARCSWLELKRIGGRGFANFFCPGSNGGWIRKASYISQSGLRPAISNLRAAALINAQGSSWLLNPAAVSCFLAFLRPGCRRLGDIAQFIIQPQTRALRGHGTRPGCSLPAVVFPCGQASTLDSLKRTDGILRQAPEMREMHTIPQAISRQSCVLFPPSLPRLAGNLQPTPGKKMTNETSIADASETTPRGGRSGPRQKRRQTGHKESGGWCGVGTPPPIGGPPGLEAGLSSPTWTTLLVAKPTQSLPVCFSHAEILAEISDFAPPNRPSPRGSHLLNPDQPRLRRHKPGSRHQRAGKGTCG
jgi:hypothetical protein